MNIVSGNMAGAFSGFLSHMAWMEIADNPDNGISVQLHARNKTQYHGNSYSNYRWFNSKDCNNFEEVIEENLLLKFFKKNQYITTDLSTDCIYTECYPSDIKDIIKAYPSSLKYDGRGGKKDQYTDLDNLEIVRNSFNKQWNKFEFTDDFKKIVKEEEKLIEGKKVMCLMLRTPIHYPEAKSDVLTSAIECVKKRIDDYDALLLTTQIQPFVDEFVKVFGDKCLYTKRERYNTEEDWIGGRPNIHITMSDDEYQREYQNVMLDVLLSSQTDLIVSASSNMFLAALCMNPEVSFDIFLNTNGS